MQKRWRALAVSRQHRQPAAAALVRVLWKQRLGLGTDEREQVTAQEAGGSNALCDPLEGARGGVVAAATGNCGTHERTSGRAREARGRGVEEGTWHVRSGEGAPRPEVVPSEQAAAREAPTRPAQIPDQLGGCKQVTFRVPWTALCLYAPYTSRTHTYRVTSNTVHLVTIVARATIVTRPRVAFWGTRGGALLTLTHGPTRLLSGCLAYLGAGSEGPASLST